MGYSRSALAARLTALGLMLALLMGPQVAAAQMGVAEAEAVPAQEETSETSTGAEGTDEGVASTEESSALASDESAAEPTAAPAEREPWEPAEEASADEADEADEPAEPMGEELSGAETVQRTLVTAGDDGMPVGFHIWEDERYGFIKPVIQISASLVSYFPATDANEELADYRISTLLLGRLGFEGELFGFLTFRSVFERNMGFSLARNGPVGTGVWEGTGSFQARENYIQLSKWGLSLTGGIFPDPASVDYVATTSLDMFGMDPYVRDPLLVSGFNQSQGFMLRYNWKWITAGFTFTGGNPLTSSLALGFGGTVASLGTLYAAPLRALSNGIPGSDIQMYLASPSLSFESDWFDIKLVAQLYEVDIDLTDTDDRHLSGYNLRGTMQGKLLVGEHFARLFASGSYRTNQQVNAPADVTTYKQDYFGTIIGAGAEYTWRNLAIGGQYYRVVQTPNDSEDPEVFDEVVTQYVVFGVTYYLRAPNVAVGLRYSRNWYEDSQDDTPVFNSTDTVTLSLRLVI